MTATQPPAQDVSDLDFDGALDALESMDDYARMEVGVAPHGPYAVLRNFITRARELQQAQVVGEDQGSWMGQALHDFTEYFAKNYPQGTEIYDPTWHAPKIFRNALWHIEQAQKRDTNPQSSAPVVGDAYAPVFAELERAVQKFPTWPTDPLHAAGVLNEEVGEMNKAILQAVYEPHKSGPKQVREEAVQVAAMALRFFCSLDQYEYRKGVQHSQRESALTGMG